VQIHACTGRGRRRPPTFKRESASTANFGADPLRYAPSGYPGDLRPFAQNAAVLEAVAGVFSGIRLSIGHAVLGALLCITIIGIPLGLAIFKMIPISLWAMGRDIVPANSANAAFIRTWSGGTPRLDL
jgi:uncharacterized membrane protein YccF (DUF307 family)